MNTTHLQDSRAIADAVNALNMRRASRANAAANFIVGFVVALLLSMALIAYAMPCEGASLCLAAITPTVRSPWARLVDLYSRWRLRAHIRSAQQDLAWQHEQMQLAQWELEHLPRAMAVTRGHIDALEGQLRNLTGNRGL